MTTEIPPAQKSQSPWSDTLVYPLGCVGACIGAALGAVVVNWAYQSGFYMIPIIGLLAGVGAGVFARKASWTVGIIAGLVTAAVGVWAEWKFVGHMIEDDSFPYFVTHLYQLASFKLLLHAAGIAAAVWFGVRK